MRRFVLFFAVESGGDRYHRRSYMGTLGDARVCGFAQKNCGWEGVPNKNFLACSEIAARLADLDTVESVAMKIHFFDGRNHGWDDGFLGAIETTSHRSSEVLRMMTRRIQDPDVGFRAALA